MHRPVVPIRIETNPGRSMLPLGDIAKNSACRRRWSRASPVASQAFAMPGIDRSPQCSDCERFYMGTITKPTQKLPRLIVVLDDCCFGQSLDFNHPMDVPLDYFSLESFILVGRLLRRWPIRIHHPHEAANRCSMPNPPFTPIVRRSAIPLTILSLLQFHEAVQILKLCLLRHDVLFAKVIQKLPDHGDMFSNATRIESLLLQICLELKQQR